MSRVTKIEEWAHTRRQCTSTRHRITCRQNWRSGYKLNNTTCRQHQQPCGQKNKHHEKHKAQARTDIGNDQHIKLPKEQAQMDAGHDRQHSMEMVPTKGNATTRKVCIISMAQGWLPLQDILHRRGDETTALCLMCGRDKEDGEHFLYCTEYKTGK